MYVRISSRDCPMGDDEIDCYDECVSETTCPSIVNLRCLIHPRLDQLCRCTTPGYQVAPDPSRNNVEVCQGLINHVFVGKYVEFVPIDYDECSDSLGMHCSFGCVNTNGGFNCSCPADFTLHQETGSCRTVKQGE